MWERLNKVLIQNGVALFAIVCCFALAFIAAMMRKEIPAANLTLVNKVIDVTLVGVVGWLFTQSKNTTKLH
jgi:hypothetical protein